MGEGGRRKRGRNEGRVREGGEGGRKEGRGGRKRREGKEKEGREEGGEGGRGWEVREGKEGVMEGHNKSTQDPFTNL